MTRRVLLTLALALGAAVPAAAPAAADAVWSVTWSGHGTVCGTELPDIPPSGNCTVHGEAPYGPFGVLGTCQQFFIENGPPLHGCRVTLDGTLTSGLGCIGGGTGTLTIEFGLLLDPNVSSISIPVDLAGAGAVLYFRGSTTVNNEVVYTEGKIVPGCGLGVFSGRAGGTDLQ